MSHLRLNTLHRLLFSVLCLVVSLWDNHLPLQYEACLTKGENFYESTGYTGQHLELNLMLYPLSKIILDPLLGHSTSLVIDSWSVLQYQVLVPLL